MKKGGAATYNCCSQRVGQKQHFRNQLEFAKIEAGI